jgi:HEAT repeat protein
VGLFDMFRKKGPGPESGVRPAEAPKPEAVKRKVASLLQKLKGSRTVGTSIFDRDGALDKIVEIGPPAVEHLIEALRTDYDPIARWTSVEALGRIGDARAVDPLIYRLANDSHADVRWHAADSLATLGDPRAIPALTAALKDPDKWVRDFAKASLDKLRAKTGPQA